MAAIVGDFNFDPLELHQQEVWATHGWVSAQTLAHEQWGQAILPTCQGATERDQIWLSPTLAAYCRGVAVKDIFADHSTVEVRLAISECPITFQTWARPMPLPWEEVNKDEWKHHGWQLQYAPTGCPTQQYAEFGQVFEDMFQYRYQADTGEHLHNGHFGRGQRTSPSVHTQSPQPCRPHRPGEEPSTWLGELHYGGTASSGGSNLTCTPSDVDIPTPTRWSTGRNSGAPSEGRQASKGDLRNGGNGRSMRCGLALLRQPDPT